MPSIPIHLPPKNSRSSTSPNPLPQLLHTPSGLAIIEIQGTIQFRTPTQNNTNSIPDSESPSSPVEATEVGRLVFPDFTEDGSEAQLKRAYLYVGKNQRLTGELRKLGKPLAILKRREGRGTGREDVVMHDAEVEGAKEGKEELEIVDVITWKLIFANRPEPVGELGGG
ncbi:MAG: hypothetical protein M1820_008842 [Bogoriella megaspora]|nr:MAG: hypothetical protein M1820_008842 [Bogoriella megaspora]